MMIIDRNCYVSDINNSNIKIIYANQSISEQIFIDMEFDDEIWSISDNLIKLKGEMKK